MALRKDAMTALQMATVWALQRGVQMALALPKAAMTVLQMAEETAAQRAALLALP